MITYEFLHQIRVKINDNESWPIWIHQIDKDLRLSLKELEQRFLDYRVETTNFLRHIEKVNNGI